MTSEKTITPNRQFWHLRPSCLILSAILVLPLWSLVGVPGTQVGGGGTSGQSHQIQHHGWPLVFAQSCSVNYDGVRKNGKFIFGVKPPKKESQAAAANELQQYLDEAKSDFEFEILHLRWQPLPTRFDGNRPGYSQERFWSDTNNWPFLTQADGYAVKWHWLGLAGNSLLLLLLVIAVAFVFQLRKRWHKRFWRPSLLEVLVCISIFSVLLAVVANEHRRATREFESYDKIFHCSNVSVHANHRDHEQRGRLPGFLANLLDNRVCLPGSDISLFVPIQSVHIHFMFENLDSPTLLENENELLEGINDLDSKFSFMSEFNEQFVSIIKKVDRSKIDELSVDIATNFSFEDKIKTSEKLLSYLPSDFSNLKSLVVFLHAGNAQGRQLSAFKSIIATSEPETVNIFGLTPSGVDYLVENRKTFSEDVLWVIHMNGDLDQKHTDKLIKNLKTVLIDTGY